jgi:Holliday junction DNA helicase RuvA
MHAAFAAKYAAFDQQAVIGNLVAASTNCLPTAKERTMIGRITGILLEKNPPTLTVDVQGLGYEVDVPMSTFYNLPATGEKVSLHTHLIVREDGHLPVRLRHRRRARRVSPVAEDQRHRRAHGAGGALRHVGDGTGAGGHAAGCRRLTKVPGIGKKTAERLLLELRDRLPKAAGGGR